jgi:hypothetical protein
MRRFWQQLMELNWQQLMELNWQELMELQAARLRLAADGLRWAEGTAPSALT